jgi:ABC-type Na+ efflux pump permease subunit
VSKVATIALREFKQTVLRKVFLIGIIGVPVLIAAALGMAVVAMLGHEQPPLVGAIAIVDPSGEVAAAARVELDPARIEADRRKQAEEIQEAVESAAGPAGMRAPPGAAGPARFDMGIGQGVVDVEVESHPGASASEIEALRGRVRSGGLLAAAIIAAPLLDPPAPGLDRDERPRLELIVGEGLDADHAGFLERRLGSAVVRVRAQRLGWDPDQAMAVLQRPEASTRRILRSGQETDENSGLREVRSQIIPMAFMMLIWIGVFTSSQHLMMSTIEEKSNRVMEVLLSAVSPMQLMAGKILGHGAVGLLIVLIYSSLTIAGLVSFALLAGQWADLAYLFVYYFMAYFMIAALMAAVGSAVTDIREANTLITPVMMVVMIPLFLWMPISQAPNGGIATAFSFIPPAIPFVMILRIAADEPVPVWQIPLTIVWGYAAVLGMVWLAARVFRVGVLMYGKPPSPAQLIKWARYR